MKETEKPRTIEKALVQMAGSINRDEFMLIEYLGPVVDGCRAALGISLEKARNLHKLSESEFTDLMEATGESFHDSAICFKATDSDERCMFGFERGRAVVYDDCYETTVLVTSDRESILSLLDSDSEFSLQSVLGNTIFLSGEDSSEIVEALGLLCYPSLLRIARSGVDPSSLLRDDADSIILTATSDLVIGAVGKWIDLQLSDMSYSSENL